MQGKGRAGVVAIALALTAGALAMDASYRDLDQARRGGTDAWREVAAIHAARARAAAQALDDAAADPAADQAMLAQARTALARANGLAGSGGLIDNPQAIDRYKQYQGELTGLLFRVAAGPGRALAGLRASLLRDEAALALARARYSRSASEFNTEASTFPGVAVAALAGYQKLPRGL